MIPRSCWDTSTIILLLANLRGAGKFSPESISIDSATFYPGSPRRAFAFPGPPPTCFWGRGGTGGHSHHTGQLAPRTDGWTHTPSDVGAAGGHSGGCVQAWGLAGGPQGQAVCPRTRAHLCVPAPSRLTAACPEGRQQCHPVCPRRPQMPSWARAPTTPCLPADLGAPPQTSRTSRTAPSLERLRLGAGPTLPTHGGPGDGSGHQGPEANPAMSRGGCGTGTQAPGTAIPVRAPPVHRPKEHQCPGVPGPCSQL